MPHDEAKPSPCLRADASALIRATLSEDALKAAQFALLNALAELLDSAGDQVMRLRDEGLDTYPLCVDARPVFGWIADTVEAIDALGWRELMEMYK